MRQIILYLFLIFIINSCTNRTDNNNNNSKISITDTLVKTNPVIDSNKIDNGQRSFMDFFEKFMWNDEYQKDRINFPIQFDNKTIESSKKWNHLKFYTADSYIPILCYDTLTVYDYDYELDSLKMIVANVNSGMTNIYFFKWLNSDWTLINIKSSTIDKLSEIEFINFIIKFSNDTIFQKTHIKFPLSHAYADADLDYETVNDTLTKDKWKHVRLTNDLNNLMILDFNIIKNNYRNIYYRGVENGIQMRYFFNKIDNEWKLIKIEDFST